MKNWFSKIIVSKFGWLVIVLLLAATNFLASSFHSRFDLTKEKRYTLSTATKNLLRSIDEPVSIDVFLKGDFPAGFRKLANGVQEFLQECKEYGRGNLSITFTDPLKNLSDSAAQRYIDSINYFFGIPAYTLQAPSK
ncbi:MAG: Gldg family protein, partial [Bacteroidetes bacterium]|nr:Gldg family protein [Bacteroidota bacterium]